MAITAATLTSNFSGFITPEQAAPYFEVARRASVVQQLVRQVPLSFRGESVPVSTTAPVANWVGEGEKKPATLGAMTLKSIVPKKLAAIAVVSDEVVRANPGNYVTSLRTDIGEAFAIAFDLATLHNLGGDGTGTGPFATWIDQTTQTHELGAKTQGEGGLWSDLVEGIREVISQNDASGRRKYRATGFAFDPLVEVRFRQNVDTTGHPIWTDIPTQTEPDAIMQPGTIMGRRSFMGEGVGHGNIAGYVGDWRQAVWGVVGGISYSVSNQATVTINGALVSLWEQNLVAIKAEAEYGFLVNDADAFCVYRNDTGS